MAFDTLEAQSPMGELAEAYAGQCLALSRAVTRARCCSFDVAYGPDRAQRLDVIAPHGAFDLPVLLFFHGGGFTHGHKEWGGFIAAALDPVVLVLARYRLIPAVSPEVLIDDAHAALAWTVAHIANDGGDPARIHVGGHSAGGALAALLALRPRGVRPTGAICISTSFNRLAITGTPGAAYDLPPGPLPIAADAPLAHIGDAATPFLIAWGGRENQRARVERSSMAMIGALRDAGGSADWLYEDTADHFDTHLLLADPMHRWSRVLHDRLHSVY